jgi:hypothetical protein
MSSVTSRVRTIFGGFWNLKRAFAVCGVEKKRDFWCGFQYLLVSISDSFIIWSSFSVSIIPGIYRPTSQLLTAACLEEPVECLFLLSWIVVSDNLLLVVYIIIHDEKKTKHTSREMRDFYIPLPGNGRDSRLVYRTQIQSQRRRLLQFLQLICSFPGEDLQPNS